MEIDAEVIERREGGLIHGDAESCKLRCGICRWETIARRFDDIAETAVVGHDHVSSDGCIFGCCVCVSENVPVWRIESEACDACSRIMLKFLVNSEVLKPASEGL